MFVSCFLDFGSQQILEMPLFFYVKEMNGIRRIKANEHQSNIILEGLLKKQTHQLIGFTQKGERKWEDRRIFSGGSGGEATRNG